MGRGKREPERLTRLRVEDLWSPDALGRRDIVIQGGRILAVLPDATDLLRSFGGPAPRELRAERAVPGLVDQHMHLLGGGDGDGPPGRMPEMRAADLFAGGVTTVGTLLGTDTRFKTLKSLLNKAEGEAAAGLSCVVYTGGMGAAPPSVLEDHFTDIALFERIVGAKAAIADPLYDAHPEMLAAMAIQLRQARAQTGKASVLHLHVGRGPEGLTPLLRLCDRTGLPPGQAMPTHVNRIAAVSPLFRQGLDWARQGGVIDFTCCLGPLDGIAGGLDPVRAVLEALEAGVAADSLTLSSDAGVAVPDGAGGFRQVPATILMRDVGRLVAAGLAREVALALVTCNPAARLGLAHRKGRIAAGFDADIVCLDETDAVTLVLSGGEIRHVGNGNNMMAE